MQLLFQVQLHGLSSTLPAVSRDFHSVFSSSPASHRAGFIASVHPRHTLAHAVKYPICDFPVVLALERLAARWGETLKCRELPRRLVQGIKRTAPADSELVNLPLIEHLLSTYGASPNSGNGYLLARAVFAQHLPLIKLLLKWGADPSLNNGWAVTTAIGYGDLPLVQLLLERERDEDTTGEEEAVPEGNSTRKRRMSGEGTQRSKRRRLEVRCKATGTMLECAVKKRKVDIANYLTAQGTSFLRSSVH